MGKESVQKCFEQILSFSGFKLTSKLTEGKLILVTNKSVI